MRQGGHCTLSEPTTNREQSSLFELPRCEGGRPKVNAVARQRDGEVVGKNLYNCHGPKSAEKIRHMMESGKSNTYEFIHHGKRYFIHHTPWFEEPGGEVSGLIELEIPVPDNYPIFNRDKE